MCIISNSFSNPKSMLYIYKYTCIYICTNIRCGLDMGFRVIVEFVFDVGVVEIVS